MKLRTLASLLLTSALAAAPAASAFADPTPIVSHAATSTPTPAPTDARRYADREAKDPKVADYAGGHRVYIIGGSVLTALVIVLLILILV